MLLELHGSIFIESICEHAETYIATPTRAAQDSIQLYECLVRSITKEGRDKVTIWKQDYMVGNPAFPSGVFLKVIIRESHIDTHATTSHIRSSLASLDQYMSTIGSDIVKFNIYVKEVVDQLMARGEVNHELLTFLFKGYKAAQDTAFVKYIEKKEEEYEEGEDTLPHILMNQAANKFKTRKLKGIWMAPTPEDEQILELTAEVDKLKKSKTKTPSLKDKASTRPPGKGKKDAKAHKLPWEDNPWMLVKPDNQAKSRKFDGKEWWWCDKHNKYGRHKPSECKGVGYKHGGKTTEGQTSNAKKRLKIATALEAITDEGEYSSGSESK
jgi:S-adenosylmethionine/arginine decarboxylase-like enzyme